MPEIRETIVTTLNPDGSVHIAPMGATVDGAAYVLAPFRPSWTLDNLRATGTAVINYTDDVRVFAGCISGRQSVWPTRPAFLVKGAVLESALAHDEVMVVHTEDHPERPRLHCRVEYGQLHAPFRGFNRAQAAVIEAAILASRLDLLSADKIDHELTYLTIAITKTAGPREWEAWLWLMEMIETWRRDNPEGAHP
ncbi:MAG: DUF447 family protein [Azospirillum sp.]|nr:DUF447 family protein [Azospirillum sp.]